MLQAARQQLASGVEVVIAVVETHGRQETEALLEGLPIVPRMQLEHRDGPLEEMDLDAVLLWHPRLVLIDELAHGNVPGSRHPKRYQDVLELLDAGIHVFTTVNIQHLESRADTVTQITGTQVRERIPDSILDIADEIALVDRTPEQLRMRLAEGRVKLAAQEGMAASSFFRESNLMALREMSLRVVAEYVDRDLRAVMQTERITGPSRSGDRLLVGVTEGPFSEKLLRYTRRLATTMEASWVAVNIETPTSLSPNQQAQLNRNLTLARKLGATVISTVGVDVAATLLRIARQENVTQIILGKTMEPWWSVWLGRTSPVNTLVRTSGEIDIHLVQPEAAPTLQARPESAIGLTQEKWRDPLRALAIVSLVTLFGLLVHNFTGYWSVALFYLVAVVVAATQLNRHSALLLALLSALLWDVLFIPPRFAFSITQFSDIVMFVVFLVVTQVVAQITGRLREREQAERHGEERANALYRITRELATVSDRSEAVRKVLQEIDQRFHAVSAVLLKTGGELMPEAGASLSLTPKEESVAAWAFQHRQPAGRFTDTLPDADAFHLPLLSSAQAEGVLVIQSETPLSFGQQELLQAIGAQLAVYLEKERALLSAQNARITEQSDRLRKTLLDSISHELKTPLAVLSGALDQTDLNRTEMQAAVRRLTRTVNLLLEATRLEEGQLQLQREWCEARDLACEAVQCTDLDGRSIHYDFPDTIPDVLCDVPLLAQALSFMIANAAQHSPPEGVVEIAGHIHPDAVVVEVLDRGRGFSGGEEHLIFEKFYRGTASMPGGLGLGLSIARQLVEAHGGSVGARNREGGGAIVWVRIPVKSTPHLPEL